jgi:hypothetical protein
MFFTASNSFHPFVFRCFSLLRVFCVAVGLALRVRHRLPHALFRSSSLPIYSRCWRSQEKKSPIDRGGNLLEVRRDETRESGKKVAGILTEGKDPEQVSDECGTGVFECVRAVGCTDSTTYTMQTSSGAGGLFPFLSSHLFVSTLCVFLCSLLGGPGS